MLLNSLKQMDPEDINQHFLAGKQKNLIAKIKKGLVYKEGRRRVSDFDVLMLILCCWPGSPCSCCSV